MKSLRVHQIAHLALVFLVIFLYLIAKTIDSQGGGGLGLLRRVIEIGGIGWAAWLAMMTVRHGIGKELPSKLLNAYRSNLVSLHRVVILNGVFAVAVLFLAYHLLRYRDLEVRANRSCELIANDAPGSVEVIATIEKDKTTRVRLKVGTRHLVARAGEELVPFGPILVRPIWKAQTQSMIQIPFPEKNYENTSQ